MNSTNYDGIPFEELELCVNILVVDAFIKCKIFESPKITIMLLPDNIHPENSLYYNGALVLDLLIKNGNHHILDLYQEVRLKREMSISVFVLCLDWLYLLDVITINSSGEIEVCS